MNPLVHAVLVDKKVELEQRTKELNNELASHTVAIRDICQEIAQNDQCIDAIVDALSRESRRS